MAEKKHSILVLLGILTDYTDENHILSSNELLSLIDKRYNMSLDRKTLYSNIEILEDMGYEIEHIKGKGFYLKTRQFDKGEMLLLCNAIHASHFISGDQSDKLINTLLKTQSKYERKEFTDKVYLPNPKKINNKDLMKNIEIISKAISEGKMLQFTYLEYDYNNKLVPKREKPYITEPRYIVYAEGKGYLVATNKNYSDYIHYRINRIADLIILDEKSEPLKIPSDSYEYANNRLYMFSGDVESVTFKCHKKIVDHIVDQVGAGIKVIKIEGDYVFIKIKTSKSGAMFLAQQYMDTTEIIEPEHIRNELKETLKNTIKKYR